MLVQKRTPNGFTLLELLISLTLFSVLSVSLYSGLSLAIKSMATGEKHTKEVKNVMAIHRLLRSRLQTAKKTNSLEKPGKLLFQGEIQSVQFVSEMPQSIEQGGLAIYKIGMGVEQAKPLLNILLTPYSKEKNENLIESLSEPVKISGVKQLTISYFGRQLDESENSWHTQWLEQNQLPIVVKIQVETMSGLVWPPFIIAIRAAVIPRKY